MQKEFPSIKEYVNELNFEGIEFPVQADEMDMQHFVCRWCISHFTHQQEIHDKHVAICRGLKKTPQADRMPSVKKGNIYMNSKNWKRRMQVPYYFVADFEALVMDIPPTDEDKDKKTKKVQEQIPCSYSYIKKPNGNDAVNNPRASKL
ncbi:uncharacterized protein LOC106094284 [Rhizophagus irregularis DAOM 181602=DAOM 197198]|nr:uncharacterized protein LOC106094284 [Rhizophagus irregularis DAOM 181602=DAOM 197198]